MSHASDDRQVLADALLAAGPDAPTLCRGWDVRDLAAHLVVREHRPDSAAGVVLPPLRSRSRAIQREYAARPLPDLVEAFRAGPPRWSPFAVPGVDSAFNLVEHAVHLEDVRRAQEGWTPRALTTDHRQALWTALTRQARLMFRSAPVGVVLVVPEGERRQVKGGPVSVVLTGEPEELLLYASGRQEQSRVEVSGPDDAVAAFAGTRLRL